MFKRARMVYAVFLFLVLNGCAYLELSQNPAEPPEVDAPDVFAQAIDAIKSLSGSGAGSNASDTQHLLAAAIPEPTLKDIAAELGTAVDDEALPVEDIPSLQPDTDLVAPVALSPQTTDDLWALSRQHFQLDLSIEHPRISAELNWYAKHPKYLERVTKRAERYYYHVLHEVIDRGMPAELALLPIVESAFDPFAYSHGRAAGPWQFIPGTAKHFGLKKSWWYDGRRDLLDSTDAALTYLSQLSDRFDGDWLLALAAYNAGGGNVSKALKRNKRQGKPTDFWSLSLPKETQAYVPKLIALAKLFKNPEQHGIALKPLPNRPYFDVVETGTQIDLAQAADLAGIEANELYLLNPGFNQWATDPDGPHRLLVPTTNAAQFRQGLQDLPAEKRVAWKRYKIQKGDSLILIAKRFKTTAQLIREVNGIKGNNIRAGKALMIPTASRDAHLYTLSASQRQEKKTRRIGLRSGKQKVEYKVRAGDSFWTIARRYGVGTRQLASWNQMAPGDPLRVGKTLTVWLPDGKPQPSSTSSRNVIRKIGYKVRNGDSLARIAGRFNVKVSDIKKWNRKIASAKYLQPGQHLTLFVDVTNSR